jgi:hypothetical protein
VKIEAYDNKGPTVEDAVFGRWQHEFSGDALVQSRLPFPKAIACAVEYVLTSNDVEATLVREIEEAREILKLEAERKRIDALLKERRGR